MASSPMLFVSVLIARAHDRFKLCSTCDAAFQNAKGQAVANSMLREHVDRILERMAPNDGFQSFDSNEVTYYTYRDAIVTVIVVANKGAAAFAQTGLTNMEPAACDLLEDVATQFVEAYPKEMVMSASKPFHFLQWDRQLAKIVRKASLGVSSHASRAGAASPADSRLTRRAQPATDGQPQNQQAGNATYDALKKELADVHGVMKQNLDDILTRGERLETMQQYSTQLKEGSQGYYKRTVHMNRMRMLQLYGPPTVILLLIVLWLWWYYISPMLATAGTTLGVDGGEA